MTTSVLTTLRSPRLLLCLITGFSSGLPLYLLLQLLPAWLKTEGLSLKTIGAFALIQFPYVFKFLWAPLLDRYAFAWLGRRKTWMLGCHLLIIPAIAALGQFSPKTDLHLIIPLLTVVAWLSATLDTALDAYRREILNDDQLGIGNALHVNAYRIAGLVPGSLALILSDHLPWSQVFFIVALFMLPGTLMSLSVREPSLTTHAPKTLRDAVVKPFLEFFKRDSWQHAVLILAFILLYKLGDYLCTSLATPFYQEMGFSKTEIGLIAKNAGLWPNVIGGLLGGLWMLRLGINRALWVFGFCQMFAILGFAYLAHLGAAPSDPQRLSVLALVIGAEAFGVGLGTTASVAFIARTASTTYAATQLALLTSLIAVPRTFIGASAGWLVASMGGWFNFYWLCFALAIPGMLLLHFVAPWREEKP